MPQGCCQPDYDALFDERAARRELAAYRRQGATGTQRTLLDAIRAAGVAGARVVDIGGGVGVIGAELLAAGAAELVDVDRSGPYLDAARSEMARRGFAERAEFIHGDFVHEAERVAPGDVVTLHRVICCTSDWASLVDRSAERARRLYGIVLPRDSWWTRVPIGLVRRIGRLFGQAWPFHVHPVAQIDARVRAAGLTPILRERGPIWETRLYRRTAPTA